MKKISMLLLGLSIALANHGLAQQPYSWENQNPVGFQENKGQVSDLNRQPVPDVLFSTISGTDNVYFTKEKICWVTNNFDPDSIDFDSLFRFDMAFVNHQIGQFVGDEKLEQHQVYYTPSAPNGTGKVELFSRIRFDALYPNIDLIVHQEKLSSCLTFELSGTAKASDIVVKITSASNLSLDAQNNELTITTPFGDILFLAQAFKDNGSGLAQETVNCYLSGGYLTFDLPNAIAGQQYVIKFSAASMDPSPLPPPASFGTAWGTYYGGTTREATTALHLDDNNNLYVAGRCWTCDLFFISAGTIQDIYQGAGNTGNGFILKFDDQRELQWSTLYGGEHGTVVTDVTTDALGNVLFVGATAAGTGTQPPTNPPGGTGFYEDDVNLGESFIAKIASNATILHWGTLFGGHGINAIEIDQSGNIYVGGFARWDKPIVVQPQSGAFNDGTLWGQSDGFVAKFSPSYQLLWSTYIGGDETSALFQEEVFDLAVDDQNNLYITGSTSSPGQAGTNPPSEYFPLTGPGGSYIENNAGGADAFAAVFDSNNALLWSTQFGGSGDENVVSGQVDALGEIEIGPNGDIYLIGVSNDHTDFDFQPSWNPNAWYSTSMAGGTTDAFIARFNNQYALDWSTFYGGSGFDKISDAAVSNTGELYLTGFTSSTDFPVLQQANVYFQPLFGGNHDVWLTRITPSDTRTWSTYIGGSEFDTGGAVAAGPGSLQLGGRVVVGANVETTDAASLPIDPSSNSNAYFDDTFNGIMDLLIAEFTTPCTTCAKTEEGAGKIEQPIATTIQLWPNPAKGWLEVIAPDGAMHLEIIAVSGQTLATLAVSEGHNSINLQSIPEGLYLFRLISDNSIATQKVILQ